MSSVSGLGKRARLAAAIEKLGGWRFLEHCAARPGLAVLNYHRIAHPATDPLYRPIISATPQEFEAQMILLKAQFEIIGHDELVDMVVGGVRVKRPRILITFDDAYFDQFEHAAPVLRRLGIPAILFVPTGFLERPRLPWWDAVSWCLRQTRKDRLEFTYPVAIGFQADPACGYEAAIPVWIARLLAARPFDEDRLNDELERQTQVDPQPSAIVERLFMRVDHLRGWVDAGLAVGSHTYHHPRLTDLEPQQRHWELIESQRWLARVLGTPIPTLAYPFGTSDAVDEPTKAMARACGYQAAFAFEGGVNRPQTLDRWAIRRFGVGHADTTSMIRGRLASLLAFGRTVV